MAGERVLGREYPVIVEGGQIVSLLEEELGVKTLGRIIDKKKPVSPAEAVFSQVAARALATRGNLGAGLTSPYSLLNEKANVEPPTPGDVVSLVLTSLSMVVEGLFDADAYARSNVERKAPREEDLKIREYTALLDSVLPLKEEEMRKLFREVVYSDKKETTLVEIDRDFLKRIYSAVEEEYRRCLSRYQEKLEKLMGLLREAESYYRGGDKERQKLVALKGVVEKVTGKDLGRAFKDVDELYNAIKGAIESTIREGKVDEEFQRYLEVKNYFDALLSQASIEVRPETGKVVVKVPSEAVRPKMFLYATVLAERKEKEKEGKVIDVDLETYAKVREIYEREGKPYEMLGEILGYKGDRIYLYFGRREDMQEFVRYAAEVRKEGSQKLLEKVEGIEKRMERIENYLGLSAGKSANERDVAYV